MITPRRSRANHQRNYHNFANVGGGSVEPSLLHNSSKKVKNKIGLARFTNILNNKQLHQKSGTIFLLFLKAVFGGPTPSSHPGKQVSRAFIGFRGNVLVRAQHMPRFLIRRVPRHNEFFFWQQTKEGSAMKLSFSKEAKTTSWKCFFIIIHQSFIKMIHDHPVKRTVHFFFGTKFMPSNSRLNKFPLPRFPPNSPAVIKNCPGILGCPDHSSTVSKSMSFTFASVLQLHIFIHPPGKTNGWIPKLMR